MVRDSETMSLTGLSTPDHGTIICSWGTENVAYSCRFETLPLVFEIIG